MTFGNPINYSVASAQILRRSARECCANHFRQIGLATGFGEQHDGGDMTTILRYRISRIARCVQDLQRRPAAQGFEGE